MKKSTPKKSFTITEAANKLGISRQGIHNAIKRKLLRAHWGKVIIRQKVLLIDAKSIENYQVSDLHQSVGKKNN